MGADDLGSSDVASVVVTVHNKPFTFVGLSSTCLLECAECSGPLPITVVTAGKGPGSKVPPPSRTRWRRSFAPW